MTRIPSYPKVWALGHPALEGLTADRVVVQEKVDGSQFSFMLDGAGEVHFRSKGADVLPEAPGMFAAGIEAVLAVRDRLVVGTVHRGEYLSKPKHNALAYSRVPAGNIILFDIEDPGPLYELPHGLSRRAASLGFESVPLLFQGYLEDAQSVKSFLACESVLGGQKIEGVVIKNHSRFGKDGKFLAGKYVSEAFKEVHAKEWKQANPSRSDFVAALIEGLRTPARWRKAVEHLRDAGQLESSPRDIGKLVATVQQDVVDEAREEIAGALFDHFRGQIKRGVSRGIAEWYKDQLLEQQFEDGAA